MKTRTVTELEIEGQYTTLSYNPIEGTLTHKITSKGPVVAYLIHDDDPLPFFMEDAELIAARRGIPRSKMSEFFYALGLDSFGEPAIENIPETDVSAWLLKNRPELSEEEFEDEDVRNAAALELWKQGRADGTIGDKYAVLLSVYSHSGERWAVAGSSESKSWPDQRWDVAHGVGIWIPKPDLRSDIDTAVAQGKDFQEVLKSHAEAWLSAYNLLCAGEVYGVVVEHFEEGGMGAEIKENCFGYLGYDYAIEMRDEALEVEAKRLEEAP